MPGPSATAVKWLHTVVPSPNEMHASALRGFKNVYDVQKSASWIKPNVTPLPTQTLPLPSHSTGDTAQNLPSTLAVEMNL